MDESEHPCLFRADRIEEQQSCSSHPWNPKSEIHGTHLSRLAGLERTGVSLVSIPPGRESFIYHAHHLEEEWIYILSGTGVADIDDQSFEVGAGDFMAFPTPSIAHHLRNDGKSDLVYLMGGENRDCEIADFPGLGKRMVRIADDLTVYDLEDGARFEAFTPDAGT